MLRHTLLVEPDIGRRMLLSSALGGGTHICAPADFVMARLCLSTTRYDLLVANIRLGAYNGLHLVYLIRGSHTRSVVYAEHDDLFFARTAQTAGAFYERFRRTPAALRGYLAGSLPPSDRRDPAIVDRRCPSMFRGSRRSADRPAS
jgi:DNA-binding NtrC family response regulator